MCPSTSGPSLSHKKERSPDTRSHVDEPSGHDVQRERQTQKDTQCVTPLTGNVLNRPNHRQSGVLAVRGWGGGREVMPMGMGFLLGHRMF